MSVTTYNVDAGKDRATIELSGETKVVFSFDPNIIAVEAVSGGVNVSLDEGATAGDDGCDTLSEGQSTRMNPIADKCIYVNGTGTVRVWGGRSGEDCPFKSGGKGGGDSGDGYSETVLYTNSTPAADPDTIALSDDYTHYDALCFVCVDNTGTAHLQKISFNYPTSQLAIDDQIFLGFGYVTSSASQLIIYQIDTATSISKVSREGADFHVYKVIGIKYDNNGGVVANPVRSLAKSEETEKPSGAV